MLFKPFGFYKPKVVAVPGVDRILDTYPGAVAGYSLRQIKKSASVAIEVTRTSDSATLDVGFDGNGDLDTGSLNTFIGANTGVVSKWYDQSGNGEHMEQSTQANMATIISSGTLITQGGKPAIRFDGSNDGYTSAQSTNPFSYTSPISVVSTVYKDTTTYKQYETIIGAGATGTASTNNEKLVGFGFGASGGVSPQPAIVTDIWRPSGIQQDGTVSTNARMIIGTYISNWSTHRSTGLSNVTLNGADVTTKTYGSFNPATPTNTNAMKLGVFDEILASSYFAGDMQEVLVWTSDENSDRVAIQTDVNTYYGVFVDNIIQTNLEQWLDADNPGGAPSTTWADTEGNFDGTVDGPTYVSGTPSYYNFPFSGNNKINCGTGIPSFMQGTGTKAYTIQFWLYADINRGNMGIFQFGSTASAGQELTLKTRGNAVGQMRMEYGGGTARNFGTPYLANANWWMVTVVQNGSTNGSINMFLDDDTEYGTFAGTTAMNLQSTGLFNIGRQDSDRWDGRFGQWILYSKALTQAEIQNNYDYFKGQYGKS